jgi:Icc protein
MPIAAVEVHVDDGDWAPMAPTPGDAALWVVRGIGPGGNVRVRARDRQGREDADRIEPANPGWTSPQRAVDGSDRDRIGAWPERVTLGTQLGPNRNGRKW